MLVTSEGDLNFLVSMEHFDSEDSWAFKLGFCPSRLSNDKHDNMNSELHLFLELAWIYETVSWQDCGKRQ